MASGDDQPTLEDVVVFFGLEPDTIPCSVSTILGVQIDKERALEIARQRRVPGEVIVLCLN